MKKLYATITQLFSFEALMVLYLFAGIYKSGTSLKQYSSVVDPTLFFFLASVIVGMSIIVRKGVVLEKHVVNLLLLFSLFVIYVVFSLSWSKSANYGVTKCLYLGILNFWNLIAAALIIAPNMERIRRFMWMIFVFSLIYAAMSLPLTMNLARERPIELTGADYQGIAFIFSCGLMVLICFLVDSSQPKIIRAACFLISCVYLWILLFVGGRGYLIAALFAMLVLFFLNPFPAMVKTRIYQGKRYVVMMLIILVAIIAMLEISGKSPATLHRLMVLSAPTAHDSAERRITLYKDGLQIWRHHIIWGAGIGSFPILIGAGDMRAANAAYPHNLIIELLAELGLVGLLFYAIILISAVKLFLKTNLYKEYTVVMFVFLLFIQCMTEAMVSGDITDHRFLMVAVGLMMMPRQSQKLTPDRTPQGLESAPGWPTPPSRPVSLIAKSGN